MKATGMFKVRLKKKNRVIRIKIVENSWVNNEERWCGEFNTHRIQGRRWEKCKQRVSDLTSFCK